MSHEFDVIIVGAGPAGCSAAYDLAKSNRKVLLIDKANFPREKPCAGGLTIKSLNALRYSVRPVVKTICKDIIIGKNISKTSNISSEYPLCVLTIRSEFDHFCFNKTLESGVTFQKIEKIIAIKELGSRVEIETDQGTFPAEFLIGADGANSIVRKLTRQFTDLKQGIAIEGKVFTKEYNSHKMEFDFGAIPFGYGWLFPKGDHVNVGLYSNSLEFNLTKQKVIDYAKAKLGSDQVKEIVGHYIGLGAWNYKPSSNRVFLVGDAAGFCEPLLGEGIFYAIRSGQLAASAIIQAKGESGNALSSFRKEIIPLKKDVYSGYQSARWFYRFPNLGYAFLTFPTTKFFLKKGFAKGMSFRAVKYKPLYLLLSKVHKIKNLN